MSATQEQHPGSASYGGDGGGGGWAARPPRRRSDRKPFYLTSEFFTMLAAIAAVVIAAAIADSFDAHRAWTLVTILAAAYIVSRGLSKIGRGDGTVGRD
jgi:hypothetical protein